MGSYDPTRDNFSSALPRSSNPAGDIRLITPHDTNQLAQYPKALRVYVPVGTNAATVRVIPAKAAADAEPVVPITLTFTPGVHVEPMSVRVVQATGLTAGVVIHGYF